MRVRTAYAALLAVLALMLAPVVLDRDSYPGSTYPMFARDRGRISTVATAVGVGPRGDVERLTPHLVAGTDEVVLAVETVARAVRAGDDRTDALCRRIADRVADARPHLVAVEIRIETHDAVDHFTTDEHEPIAEDVRARCRVA